MTYNSVHQYQTFHAQPIHFSEKNADQCPIEPFVPARQLVLLQGVCYMCSAILQTLAHLRAKWERYLYYLSYILTVVQSRDAPITTNRQQSYK